MFPKLKVMRNGRQVEGTPSRHPRRGARAAVLIVLGGGMVGLWSAPMAQAAGHDSFKTFRSTVAFAAPEDDGEAEGGHNWADFEHNADVDGGYDRADSKADAHSDADDWADFKDDEDVDAGYDLKDWDFDDDGFKITVIVNNNNNNNNGGGTNNNNN
ncbi:hypothetical protein ACFVTC_29070 [Streptomyces sp. NPDC057950]|uniref:hypothetical protein n=1 Tax=Streptomyces sp. NPDC057950 TaxID=3346288 RepID=UPI0036EF3948